MLTPAGTTGRMWRHTYQAIALLQANTGMGPGQEVLLAYGWSRAAWAEIDSGVIGMCAWEERGAGSGLGEEGGQYIEV